MKSDILPSLGNRSAPPWQRSRHQSRKRRAKGSLFDCPSGGATPRWLQTSSFPSIIPGPIEGVTVALSPQATRHKQCLRLGESACAPAVKPFPPPPHSGGPGFEFASLRRGAPRGSERKGHGQKYILNGESIGQMSYPGRPSGLCSRKGEGFHCWLRR